MNLSLKINEKTRFNILIIRFAFAFNFAEYELEISF